MKVIRLILILLVSYSSFAQTSSLGNWVQYHGNNAISKKLNYHNEIQYRSYNFIDDLQQLLIRTGLGYNLTENNNNVLFGYCYVRTENYVNASKIGNDEHRIYQQYVNKSSFGRVSLMHRYRFEERFLEGNVFKFRLRYSLGLNIALSKSYLTNNTIYLAASNEVFMNTKGNEFDRNRIYGGLGYVINKKYRIEVGYLSQRTSASERGQTVLAFFNTFPFYKMDSN
jgi:hypothetical protein